MLSPRTSIIVVHVVGWLLFFTLIIAFVHSSHRHISDTIQLFSFSRFLFFLLYIALFYFNTSFLFPKLYLKKNYAAYVAILVALFLLVLFLQPFDRLIARHYNFSIAHRPPFTDKKQFPLPPDFPGKQHLDIVSIVLFLMIISLSTVSSLIKQWRTSEKKAAKAEADKARAKLSFLKAQINPHFLFNTLNNIYALAVTKDEKAADAVMKLSNIMRYVTDEVSEDFVSLEKEVASASDYIDLQKLRLNEKAKIDFKITGDIQGRKIAPLIFMSFIENSFKHGISSHEVSPVTIHIATDQKAVTLFCQNKIFSHLRNTERPGIGIANARQRLQYLYANKHLLTITQEKGLYTVQLIVQM
jgi:hypothetical protein